MATLSNNQKYKIRPEPGELDIYHIMSLLPVMPYQEIADVCCGEGTLSVPLGKLVYRGKVTALDTVKKDLTAARKQLKNIRLTNVKASHISDETSLPLKDESIDGAMASFFYQASKNPQSILKELSRSLKKGGWLALIEWQKEFGESAPPEQKKISPEKCREIAEKEGFRFYIRHDLSDMAYMLLLRK